ncbi:MAG: EamA family transporter [Armatimonadetes bacterium]|nr:EamA family transporter [Armatimonadota bacterium]
MSQFVILLVLCSTVMHAGWNLLARRERAESAFFNRMLLAVAVGGLVPMVISEGMARSFGLRVWGCLAGSGICCGLYYLYLARAYASSDFTIVYPLARALPVILVGLGDVMRGRYPTVWGWGGMAMVVGGCLLVPLRSFRDFSVQRYLNRTGLWVALTALGTFGYTLFDKMAAEVVRQGPWTAARYGYFFFLVSYAAYILFLRPSLKETFSGNSVGWLLPVLAGLLNFGAYWLILWAYQLSPYASYIVAFRQFSIVIGVVLAFLLYHERGAGVRLSGTLVIALGLILIGVWGK